MGNYGYYKKSGKEKGLDYWVGVTDPHWFSVLSTKKIATEINFWQPSLTPPTTQLREGDPFFFKLKRPYHHISGGAYFVSFSTMPIWLAWEIFDEANGFATFDEMVRAFTMPGQEADPHREIGCTTLTSPFYLPRQQWLDVGSIWHSAIQRGKSFDLASLNGKKLWNEIMGKCNFADASSTPYYGLQPSVSANAGTRSAWVKQRLGQNGFRVLVTSAYRGRCAITGESTLDVLEAAHIRPFADQENHDVRNGLLLRADFHRLFDRGLVSVTPDLEIRISPQIRERYFNGKAYYRLDGQRLQVVPNDPQSRPDPQRLEWHFSHRFQSA